MYNWDRVTQWGTKEMLVGGNSSEWLETRTFVFWVKMTANRLPNGARRPEEAPQNSTIALTVRTEWRERNRSFNGNFQDWPVKGFLPAISKVNSFLDVWKFTFWAEMKLKFVRIFSLCLLTWMIRLKQAYQYKNYNITVLC